MIPLYVLLIIYFIFLAIFAAFMIINVYHIVMSASMTAVSFFVTFTLLAAGVLTIYGTFALLQGFDFTQPLFSSNTF